MGKILAYSGLMEGKEVTWMPAYGPEQRGGTANVTVIVSDERISSPILSTYDIAIVLNQPSLDKFEPKVKHGKIFNMIVLGGLLEVCPVVSHAGMEKALYKTLPERHHGLIPLNMQALEEGGKIISRMAR